MHRDRDDRERHPICVLLRELRLTAGLSLAQVESRHGISPVVLGSYERGDREPPLRKLDKALNMYGYQLAAVPLNTQAIRRTEDMVADLRAMADQLEARGTNDALHAVPDPATREI